MDWQQITSLLIVALAAVLLVRHTIRERRAAKLRPCGMQCGCGSETLGRIATSSQKMLEGRNGKR